MTELVDVDISVFSPLEIWHEDAMSGMIFSNPPAVVQQDEQSEQALVNAARQAIDTSNWTVGEAASIWTVAHSRGRSDEDFAELVGASRSTVNTCRRVWDRFGLSVLNASRQAPLSFTHYREALAWSEEVADDCLQWALEQQATVSEMKAWHRENYGTTDSGLTSTQSQTKASKEQQLDTQVSTLGLGQGQVQPVGDESPQGDEPQGSRAPVDASGNTAEADAGDAEPGEASKPEAGTPTAVAEAMSASNLIVKIREIGRYAEAHFEPEDAEEIADELRRWDKRLRPENRFTPPTAEDVRGYCSEEGLAVDAEQFVSYYASVNWRVGRAKKKMANWKLAVRTWANRNRGSGTSAFDTVFGQ